MNATLRITFKNMASSNKLERAITEWANKVQKFHPDPLELHVLVARPTHRHQSGNPFHVTVDAHVRGAHLAVTRAHDDGRRHEDPYAAVADTFRLLRRELMEHTRIRRGAIKHHEEGLPPTERLAAA